MTASSSKKILCQWLDRAALQKLPSLRPDTRIQEINTDNNSNKYGYLYDIYYPEDTAKEAIGIVFHKDTFYQFFHSSTTGNPYLGALLKEANQYKFQDNVSTEEDEGAKEQLTLRIHNSLVTINQGQPGSPKRTRVSWTQSATSSITSSKSKVPQVNPMIRPACDPEKQGARAKPSGDPVSRDQTRNKSPDLSYVLTHDKSRDSIRFGRARSPLINKWQTVGTVCNQRRHVTPVIGYYQ
jgi:hypothetical protein